MKKYIPIICLAFVFISFSGVCADQEIPPYSYTLISPDGNYIFAMLAPYSAEEECEGYPYSIEEKKRVCEIREKYRKSGLYRVDDPTTPLWTVDWFAFSVEVASDGIHLIRPGFWDRTYEEYHEAVSFFRNGKLIKAYEVKDLADFRKLMPHSVSHFVWRSEYFLVDQDKTYFLSTLYGEKYVFDITTGEIISSFRTPRWIIALVTVAVALLIYRRNTRKGKNMTPQQTEASMNKKWLRFIALFFLVGSVLSLYAWFYFTAIGEVQSAREKLEFPLNAILGLIIFLGLWRFRSWGWKFTVLVIPVSCVYDFIDITVFNYEPCVGAFVAPFFLINALILNFLHKPDVKKYFSMPPSQRKNMQWSVKAILAMAAFLFVHGVANDLVAAVLALSVLAVSGKFKELTSTGIQG